MIKRSLKIIYTARIDKNIRENLIRDLGDPIPDKDNLLALFLRVIYQDLRTIIAI